MNGSYPRLASLASAFAVSMFVQLATAHDAGAVDPTPAQTAEQLSNEAYDLHAAGKYPEAIAAYFKAYELSPAAAILFNIATIYDRKLGERTLAADFYRRYLLAPDAEPGLVKKATERLADMKREAKEEASAKKNVVPLPQPAAAPGPAPPPPAPAPTVVPPDETSRAAGSGNGLRVAGLTVAGIGVITVGAGLVLGLVAKSKNDQANAFCTGAACRTEGGLALAHQAGDFATASTATFVPGLVLLVGGLTLFFVAPRGASGSQRAQLTFGPMVGTTEAGLTARGTF